MKACRAVDRHSHQKIRQGKKIPAAERAVEWRQLSQISTKGEGVRVYNHPCLDLHQARHASGQRRKFGLVRGSRPRTPRIGHVRCASTDSCKGANQEQLTPGVQARAQITDEGYRGGGQRSAKVARLASGRRDASKQLNPRGRKRGTHAEDQWSEVLGRYLRRVD